MGSVVEGCFELGRGHVAEVAVQAHSQSKQSPTLPMEPRMPAWRSRLPNSHDV